MTQTRVLDSAYSLIWNIPDKTVHFYRTDTDDDLIPPTSDDWTTRIDHVWFPADTSEVVIEVDMRRFMKGPDACIHFLRFPRPFTMEVIVHTISALCNTPIPTHVMKELKQWRKRNPTEFDHCLDFVLTQYKQHKPVTWADIMGERIFFEGFSSKYPGIWEIDLGS